LLLLASLLLTILLLSVNDAAFPATTLRVSYKFDKAGTIEIAELNGGLSNSE
jgi:uncharacterized membrane protein